MGNSMSKGRSNAVDLGPTRARLNKYKIANKKLPRGTHLAHPAPDNFVYDVASLSEDDEEPYVVLGYALIPV